MNFSLSMEAAVRIKKVAGWKLAFFSSLLAALLIQMYAGLGMYLMSGDHLALLIAISGGAVSFITYQNVSLSYFEWRVLELTIPLIGSLNGEYKENVPEATHASATYMAVLAITQYVKIKGLSGLDKVFRDFFPEARMSTHQRKLLGEICDIAPFIRED